MKDTPSNPERQSGLALGFFSRYLDHPPGFGAKILKIEPKLASKSKKLPDHRIQTILLSFFLKVEWSFSSLHSGFKSYRLTGANQELSIPTQVTKDFANMKFRSTSDSNLVKVQASFGNLVIS